MKTDDKIHGFLYSMWPGYLNVTEGEILHISKYTYFIRENDTKKICCHSEPEKIYNGLLWLEERDDEKAINLLIEYHEREVKKLKEKINSHLEKIIQLQGRLVKI